MLVVLIITMTERIQTPESEVSDIQKYPKPEGYIEPSLVYQDGILTSNKPREVSIVPNDLNTTIAIEKNPPPVIMTVADSPEEEDDDEYNDYDDDEDYW